jgi:hypothetical protein
VLPRARHFSASSGKALALAAGALIGRVGAAEPECPQPVEAPFAGVLDAGMLNWYFFKSVMGLGRVTEE